ncbi:MAG: hypothetical protein AAGD96_09630 [Chloroflexota bacterium]
MIADHPIFQKAENFIWTNGRLLERRLFAYHFKEGSAQNVISALLGFQNADGGFGNALEPDIRCPDSQPVPCQHALEILDGIGFDAEIVTQICDFLTTITTAEGGVPWVLPAVMDYPHAQWWQAGENPPASINPTGIICTLLHKNNFEHPWLKKATEFCWRVIEGDPADEMHDMGNILQFLRYAPDKERAAKQLSRHADHLLNSGLAASAGDEGYVWKPIDWAPYPDDPLRKHFDPVAINSHLKEIVAEQEEDGGWPISFPPFSPACHLEWRGWVTLGRLKMLRANGFFEK